MNTLRRVLWCWFVFAATCVGFHASAAEMTDAIKGGVSIKDERQTGSQPTAPPRTVYVQDFLLDHASIETDEGVRGRLRPLQRAPRARSHNDPQKEAEKLVTLMSEALVKQLGAAGLPAQRLQAGTSLPKDGWLIRGAFTEVDEGNRMKRAVIGFGSGATSMEAQVSASDLAGNPDAPFIIFGTIKDPSKMPGAVVTMNPFVAGAKFAMEKNASEKDVDRTAKEIVQEMIKYKDKFKEQAESHKPIP